MAVHPTATIEPAVTIGRGTVIWDNVHVRHSSRIGEGCIIGEKTYIAYGVHVGDRVKIDAHVYISAGAIIERGVIIGAGTVLANSDTRRAATQSPVTRVREGATIGANSTIRCGVTVGRFSTIGMGSVLLCDVPDFAFVAGNPAAPAGYVCACGAPLPLSSTGASQAAAGLTCVYCDARYEIAGGSVVQLSGVPHSPD